MTAPLPPVPIKDLRQFPASFQDWLRILSQNIKAISGDFVTHTGGNLTTSALVLGNGAADVSVLGSLGTTSTVLHGNASGPPSFGKVALGADVSGSLPAGSVSGLSTIATSGSITDAIGTLLVGHGGTGQITLTAHSVLIGAGTSVITQSAVGATNTVLHGNTGADPTFSAVVEGDLGLTDITTANVSATAHGFAPKFPNNTTTFLRGDGTYAAPPGSGTVTTVSVATANGVSGSVANPTTTPAITLTLGAITPTSVNFGQTSLSYYGEGTWTPSDQSGASLTFTSPTGTYTRIGRLVYAAFHLTYPATISASNAIIGSLPFTVVNSEEGRQGFSTYDSATVAISVLTNKNATTVNLANAVTGNFVTNATMSAAVIYGTALYPVT